MLIAQWILLVLVVLKPVCELRLTFMEDPAKRPGAWAMALSLAQFMLVWWTGAFELIIPFPWR